MIIARFRSKGGLYTGYTVSGHAGGSANAENNLICAAVSSAAYMTVNTITDVIFCEADCEDRDGYMRVDVTGAGERAEAASTVIAGLRLHLKELADTYPGFITLEEF